MWVKKHYLKVLCIPLVAFFLVTLLAMFSGCGEYDQFNPEYCSEIEKITGFNVHWTLFTAWLATIAGSALSGAVALLILSFDLVSYSVKKYWAGHDKHT